jgi:hypothetical protein
MTPRHSYNATQEEKMGEEEKADSSNTIHVEGTLGITKFWDGDAHRDAIEQAQAGHGTVSTDQGNRISGNVVTCSDDGREEVISGPSALYDEAKKLPVLKKAWNNTFTLDDDSPRDGPMLAPMIDGICRKPDKGQGK